MSYSRWGNSIWYTYWAQGSTDKKEDQVFNIQGMTNFTYNQIQYDLDKCLATVDQYAQFTRDEIQELKGYMSMFVQDMDRFYAEKDR